MDRLESLYRDIEGDMAVLAGEEVCGAAWQDVAGTLAVNLQVLASALDDVRSGKRLIAGRFRFEGVFPSMREICDRPCGG